MSDPIGQFFETLVLPTPRPYAERAPTAQQRVADLLDSVANPHRRLRCIHIAGSKGKGSTALYAEAIAEASGLKTATFTSPHLESWTERFRIGGRAVGEASLIDAIERLRPIVAALKERHREDPPTFFDVLTTLAFMLFAEAGVDLAFIEAGIGARLDATTVAPALVACLTTVEKEHTDKLGATLERIAIEKAGVIRPGKPLVLGKLPTEAQAVVIERARAADARVSRIGRDFHADARPVDAGHSALHFQNPNGDLKVILPQPAPYIALNAALAIECLLQTRLTSDKKIFETAIRCLSCTRLPARVEVLAADPPIIVDAAHTAVSMTLLTQVLVGFDTPFLAVLSLSGAKEIDVVFAPLMSVVTRIITTQADPTRSMPAESLAEVLRERWPKTRVTATTDPDRALALAYREHQQLHSGICVTGSVYLAGRGRRVLRCLLNKAVLDEN